MTQEEGTYVKGGGTFLTEEESIYVKGGGTFLIEKKEEGEELYVIYKEKRYVFGREGGGWYA